VIKHTEVETRTAKEITKLQALAYELKVKHAMTKDVISVSPYSTMAELMEVLRANRISGAPVVEGGRMIGIISIEDLIEVLAAGEMNAAVGEKMTPNLVVLYANEPLVHAVSKFNGFRFGRFPVVDRGGDLVGIVTQGDVARAMLKRLEVDYHKEGVHRYRASHIFEDVIADEIALVLSYRVAARDFDQAGKAASGLRRTLTRLDIDSRVIRRVAVAAYEAVMNIVIFTDGGEIVVDVRPDRVRIEALDKGPGIPNIEQAMQLGFSTAPQWAQEMGFGAGVGLPNIQECADEMKLESRVGIGTRLEIVIYAR
jgi:CBS domain-containing protein/anti-sigma regulatory factor (Ser/Thr protein kinase)